MEDALPPLPKGRGFRAGNWMNYIATHRCPRCKGANTTVKLVELPKTHKQHDASMVFRWTCLNCQWNFPASDVPLSEAIIPCSKCKEWMPHKFVRHELRAYHSPTSLAGKKTIPEIVSNEPPVHNVHSHIWVCFCGTERLYGCHG